MGRAPSDPARGVPTPRHASARRPSRAPQPPAVHTDARAAPRRARLPRFALLWALVAAAALLLAARLAAAVPVELGLRKLNAAARVKPTTTRRPTSSTKSRTTSASRTATLRTSSATPARPTSTSGTTSNSLTSTTLTATSTSLTATSTSLTASSTSLTSATTSWTQTSSLTTYSATTPIPVANGHSVATAYLYARAGTASSISIVLPPACATECYISGVFAPRRGFPNVKASFRTGDGPETLAADVSAAAIEAKTSQPARIFEFLGTNPAALSAGCPGSAVASGLCTLTMALADSPSTMSGMATLVASSVPLAQASGNLTARTAAAMATGNSGFLTGDELRAALYADLASSAGLRTILDEIYGNVPGKTSITGITWDPTHDSLQLKVSDPGYTTPLVVTNFDYKGTSNSRILLGAAGSSLGGQGGRFVAFGANALHDLNQTGTRTNAAFGSFVQSSLEWVNKGAQPAKITVAQIEDSYWFRHDQSTVNTLRSFYPSATINGINWCDNANLAGCLATSDLLVISRSSNTSTNVDDILSAVAAFAQRKLPVVFVHFDGDSDALSTGLLDMMGLAPSGDNYWAEAGLKDASLDTTLAGMASGNDPVAGLRSVLDTLTGVTPLADADVSACFGAYNTWMDCPTASLKAKISTGAQTLRSLLNSLDASGTDLFSVPGRTSLKLAAMLGDKYRAGPANPDGNTPALAYPIPRAQLGRYAAAMFADASALYRRGEGARQDEMGSLYCPLSELKKGTCVALGYDFRGYEASVPVNAAVDVAEPLPKGNVWTATGLFAMPGRPVTVRRTDAVADVDVSIQIWFQRTGVTKSMELDGTNLTGYNRPQWPKSPGVKLEINRTITITAPHGGPLYLSFGRVPEYRSAGKDTGVALRVRFGNVAKHPAILDVGNEAEVAAFVASAKANPLPAIDLRGEGFEVHMRRDKLFNALVNRSMTEGSTVPGAPIFEYGRPDGLKLLLDDYRIHFIRNQYVQVGWKPPGLALEQSVPPYVQALCNFLGWTECFDATLNVPFNIQHTNYDERANCGYGCSGNPWDAAWDINPLGWGEGHELGHNLQKTWMNLDWVDEANKNKFTSYSGRSGENSNNIFPYQNRWRWWRVVKGFNGTATDSHFNFKHIWSIMQSAKAGLTATVNGTAKLVTVDGSCKIVGSFPLGTDPALAVYETMWSDGMNANGHVVTNSDANSQRIGFYVHLFMTAAGWPLADGATVLQDGFGLVPLLYVLGRMVDKYGAADADWAANKDRLGFGSYPRTTAADYTSVRDMRGNDMLLVGLSFLTGRDWRPFFDARGIRRSTYADGQVAAHVAAGRVAGAVRTEFPALDTQLPGIPMDAVGWIPVDGTSAWRDGYSPKNCAL